MDTDKGIEALKAKQMFYTPVQHVGWKFSCPDRTGSRRRRSGYSPVASSGHHDFHIRASAQARVLASSSLVLSSCNVLLFSLLLLLTAEETFLSRESDIPTLDIILLMFPLRLNPMKTPRSFPLLMMSSSSFTSHHFIFTFTNDPSSCPPFKGQHHGTSL